LGLFLKEKIANLEGLRDKNTTVGQDGVFVGGSVSNSNPAAGFGVVAKKVAEQMKAGAS